MRKLGKADNRAKARRHKEAALARLREMEAEAGKMIPADRLKEGLGKGSETSLR